jgi:8-oxo-dGTP pyrophosphatase MutT (NUDIX family)
MVTALGRALSISSTDASEMTRAIQRFEVSLKAFVLRDERALLVRESDTGYWELPGGRIDVGEEWQPHANILARDIAEELGPSFRVEIAGTTVTWTRRRPSDNVFQFIVGHLCRHISGDPILSGEHDRLAWCTPDDWMSLQFPPESGYLEALSQLWRQAIA